MASQMVPSQTMLFQFRLWQLRLGQMMILDFHMCNISSSSFSANSLFNLFGCHPLDAPGETLEFGIVSAGGAALAKFLGKARFGH